MSEVIFWQQDFITKIERLYLLFINVNGLEFSIWTNLDKIVDGRNRYKACGSN